MAESRDSEAQGRYRYQGRVVIIAGTGVSIEACGNQQVEGHPVASWVPPYSQLIWSQNAGFMLSGRYNYRCSSVFTRLIGWLRSKGVISRTPLHTLRKEFGSQINAAYGLTAASEMLRHSDITITARHYIEGKRRPSLDHLLKSDRISIPIDEAQAS